MSFAKRIGALETVAMKANKPERFDVIRTIFAPDRSIVKALRREDGGVLVPLSEDELADIRCGRS